MKSTTEDRATYRKILGSRATKEQFQAILGTGASMKDLISIHWDDPGLKYYIRRDGWRIALDIPLSSVKDLGALEALMARYKDAH